MSEHLLRESPLIEHIDAPQGRARFTSGGVEAAEHAFLTYVNLRGNAQEPAFVEATAAVLGCRLPTRPNTVVQVGPLRIFWLGPDEWLVLGPQQQEFTLPDRLRKALTGQHVAVTEVGHGHTLIRLTGSGARELLATGCPLDLHPRSFGAGDCAQSHLAKALVTIAMVSDPPGFDLIVRRSFADYLWQWIKHAASSGGI